MNPALREFAHRPWPMPHGRWVMAQVWHDLLFAHWPVDGDKLRGLLPRGLELDTFRGQAWIALVPFRMSGVRLRHTIAVPRMSSFPELNVRTYVVRDGKPGVWFFSLDAASAVAVEVARTWFHLPYFRARMKCVRTGEGIVYSSERRDPRGRQGVLRMTYSPAGAAFSATRGSLEHFLTERYCLYAQDARGSLYRSEIHHPPWQLQLAETGFTENSMLAADGLETPAGAPLLHFSRRQDVVVWPLQLLTS